MTFAMDRKFGNENPKHIYTMHDGNAFAINVVALNNSCNKTNNNNNNEKMDDANQTTNETKLLTKNNLIQKESNNGDRSADVLQQCVNFDDTFVSQPEQLVDLSYLRNDNQSNGSDVSDNNSTDNISFVSDDSVQRLNFSDQQLNHVSDDESNSDDIIYAYRGANFEPVDNVNADDETDYLEMDFEPDPASEIEQENAAQNELPKRVGVAVSPHFDQSATTFEMVPLHSHNNETHLFNVSIDNFNFSGSEWLATHERRINGIDINIANPNNTIKMDRFAKSPNCKNDFRMENNNPQLNWQSMEQGNNKSVNNSDTLSTVSIESGQQNAYYDKTVSLSTTKYTGTIPKTSRSTNNRAIKTKPTVAIANGNETMQFNYESQPSCSHHNQSNGMIIFNDNSWSANNNKRWKINDESQSTSLLNSENVTPSTSSHSNTMHVTSKMCFMPFSLAHEDMLNQRNECHSDESKSFDDGQRPTSTLSNNDIFYGPKGEQNIDSNSVTFRSSYCSHDTIANALKTINVLPNMTVLQEALQIDESGVSSMNIPEYLIHVSKLNSNYRAVMSAIERSCSNVNVRFFVASEEPIEWVQIPVQDILSRLPYNGSLTNILNIENKRFHQANVLGKIVSAIRRYADMRNDVNHNEFIAIPQFYRSGFICVTKIESGTQQNQS